MMVKTAYEIFLQDDALRKDNALLDKGITPVIQTFCEMSDAELQELFNVFLACGNQSL